MCPESVDWAQGLPAQGDSAPAVYCTQCDGADGQDGLIDCHGRALILLHGGQDAV